MSLADINPNECSSSQSLASRFAVAAINGYRHNKLIRVPTRLIMSRTLSPNFRCASGVMGLDTCSAAGLKNFTNYPLWEAIQKQKQDFQTCRDMHDIHRFAIAHDTDEAIAYITANYDKTEDEAKQLVTMAMSDKAIREQIRKEVQKELKRKGQNQQTDCCTNSSPCGGLGRMFRRGGRGLDMDIDSGGCDLEMGNCDLAGCDTGGCDIGGCDVGGCN